MSDTQTAAHQFDESRLQVLAHALLEGYDGVDIVPPQPVTAHRDGFEMVGWVDEPPRRGMVERQWVPRYDFRTMPDHEKRELLAHIGVMDTDEIADSLQEDRDAE